MTPEEKAMLDALTGDYWMALKRYALFGYYDNGDSGAERHTISMEAQLYAQQLLDERDAADERHRNREAWLDRKIAS